MEEAAIADGFAEFDLAELTAILTRASRGRFRQAKAEDLRALARRSVGVPFLVDAIQVQMRCLLDQIAFESLVGTIDRRIL